MSMILPINIEGLLTFQGVESARVELKAGWDEKTTGVQILKTICAFANDFQNLNGGYIVLGVEEIDGKAAMPPKGLDPKELDLIQNWIRGNCNRIDPEYQPVISAETVAGRTLLVLWVPGSDNRPHRAPDGENREKKFFVRIGSSSVDAEKNGVLQQLLQLTARIPFDDRRSFLASTDDMRESKVKEYLNDIGSALVEEGSTKELYRKMRIAVPVNGHDAPKNVGLLMFSENPEKWFSGTRIEVVHFADDASGSIVEERIFRGGIHEQLKNALAYLEGISSFHMMKQDDSFRVKGWVSYPIPALREALVNAVYHKGYEDSVEPVKVYLYSDRIEIISYPGPVPGINMEHLEQRSPMPPVPARNRRIGEYLKELRLAEGRGTGLPKMFRTMKENGSLAPRFDFDEGRTYFRVVLPAHPEYVAVSALRDSAHLRAIGYEEDAFRRIENAWKAAPLSPTLAAEYIRLLGKRERFLPAESVYETFLGSPKSQYALLVSNVMVEAFLDAGRDSDAARILDRQPEEATPADALDAAFLARRLKADEKAHSLFERAGSAVLQDSRALHEFAQTKISLARALHDKNENPDSQHRLLKEAMELLERVVRMDIDRTRQAWAWRDLGRVRAWLEYPKSEVHSAYERALLLKPDEAEFMTELGEINAKRS